MSTSSYDSLEACLYEAFGQLLCSTGSTVNPFRYVGGWGYYSDAADRLYVRARYYDPLAGHWMSVDPIGFEAGTGISVGL